MGGWRRWARTRSGRWRGGPVVFDSTYGGEDYDARKEEPFWWNSVAFHDDGWAHAVVVDGPGGALLPAVAPEVVRGTLRSPVKVTKPAAGKTVL